MIEVGVGEHNRVQLGKRIDFRNIEIGCTAGIVRFFPAVDQDPAVRRSKEERGTADLPAAAEHGDPYPLVFFYRILAHLFFTGDIPVYPPPDGPQELLTFLVHGPEVLAGLLDCRTLDGGSPDNFWRPPDMTGDIPQCCPVLPDDNPWFFCFDQHFTGIGIKKDIRDAGSFRDNGLDFVVCLLGVFENRWPDHDPLAKVPGKDLDQVRFISKPFRIIRVNDQFGSFELDLRHRYAMGHFLVYLVFELFEPFFNQHKKVVLKKVIHYSWQDTS